MKRFHVNLSVADLARSVKFYSMLFGESPSVLKTDYAKWMLEDPIINFSLSESERGSGINHIGLQAESVEELAAIQKRLHLAGQETFEQPDAECCYSSSTKTWVRDPDDVAWESFVTHADLTHYGTDDIAENSLTDEQSARCCATESDTQCCV
jgi:predicted lactoylglutathione lyase